MLFFYHLQILNGSLCYKCDSADDQCWQTGKHLKKWRAFFLFGAGLQAQSCFDGQWAPAALVRFGENPCHIQLPHQLLSPCILLIPSNKTSNKLTLENSCLNESKLHRSSNDTQHSEIILHCIWTQVSPPEEYMRFKRQLSNGGAAWTEEYGDGIGRCSTA